MPIAARWIDPSLLTPDTQDKSAMPGLSSNPEAVQQNPGEFITRSFGIRAAMFQGESV
jgi:hypothetical protein